MSRERGILFKDFLVRKILAGEKTQTRRLAKPGRDMARFSWSGRSPYGSVGDRLWVRETWAARLDEDHKPPREVERVFMFRADKPDEKPSGCGGGLGKWRPGIHLPRRLARIRLELTEVRVQRCQDISSDDIEAEGFSCPEHIEAETPHGDCPVMRRAFAASWDRINADRGGSWKANPLVWALSFRRLKP